MSVVVLLIVAGGMVAAGFLVAFAWAVQSGQYDDTCTPAVRVLLEDGKTRSLEVGQTRRQEDRTKEGIHVDVDH